MASPSIVDSIASERWEGGFWRMGVGPQSDERRWPRAHKRLESRVAPFYFWRNKFGIKFYVDIRSALGPNDYASVSNLPFQLSCAVFLPSDVFSPTRPRRRLRGKRRPRRLRAHHKQRGCAAKGGGGRAVRPPGHGGGRGGGEGEAGGGSFQS